jgi:hypothetical protein
MNARIWILLKTPSDKENFSGMDLILCSFMDALYFSGCGVSSRAVCPAGKLDGCVRASFGDGEKGILWLGTSRGAGSWRLRIVWDLACFKDFIVPDRNQIMFNHWNNESANSLVDFPIQIIN